MAKTLWISRCLCAALAVASLAASSGRAQVSSAPVPSPQTVEDVLHQMADQADVIFVGEVVAIRPHEGGGVASGFVEVDFRVNQAIRGSVSGGTYTLREWAGLWSGNASRYQIGQRLLMLLHAPGASGLSSPVGGIDGAIPIRGGGTLALANAATPTPVVDLRWLGVRLPQSTSYKISPTLPPTPLTLSQQMATKSVRNPAQVSLTDPIASEDDTSSRASVPVQQASVDTVVKLLASWKKAADDVR